MIALLLAVLVTTFPALSQDDACLMCHGNEAAFAGNERAALLVVDAERLEATVHGAMGFGCTTCHPDVVGDKVFGHAAGGEAAAQPAVCWTCHPKIITEFNKSMHGYLAERGNQRAPTCATCHTPHGILKVTNPDSPASRGHVQETCESCHGQEGELTIDFIRLPDTTKAYTQSVHSVLAEDGLPRATCSDCHDTHALKGGQVPGSHLPPCKDASTCGKCHVEIDLAYQSSIHGRALAAGVVDSPSCTDCHGEHNIMSPSDPDSPTSAGHQSLDTCGPCHEDPEILTKYGLQYGVLGSYEDSYHGWAAKLLDEEAATCVDCHTAHEVYPAEDPRSTVHVDKVVQTCAACHPGADATFAISYNHVSASMDNNPINRVIQIVYWVLITGVIGGMALHNLLIFSWFFRQRRKELAEGETVLRMSGSELIQHLLLTITFFGLVITGFALRFPEAFWVEWLLAVGFHEPARALLHRIFALGMVGTSVWHLAWLMTPRGRKAVVAMLPRFSDVLEAKDNLLLHMGLTHKHPRYGMYDYTQKAEYWALIWGTGVMVFTGFVLWYPTVFTDFLPWWVVPASQTLHYYEAWLAFLAIVIWHGFYVIVHPSRYPMDFTWITGRMPKDHAEHDHPRWDPEPEDEKKS